MEQGTWPSYQRAENRKSTLAESVVDLEKQLNQLIILSQAMWELLKEETQLTEEDLKEKLKVVQTRKESQSPLCPYCNRTIQLSTGKCLYCGASVERGSFDDLYFRY